MCSCTSWLEGWFSLFLGRSLFPSSAPSCIDSSSAAQPLQTRHVHCVSWSLHPACSQQVYVCACAHVSFCCPQLTSASWGVRELDNTSAANKKATPSKCHPYSRKKNLGCGKQEFHYLAWAGGRQRNLQPFCWAACLIQNGCGPFRR